MSWKQPLSIKEIINLVENENNNKQNNKQIAETFCYNVKNLSIPKDPSILKINFQIYVLIG